MLTKIFVAFLGISALTGVAHAEPGIDLAPKSLTFRTVRPDDVSPNLAQRVSLKITNLGNVSSKRGTQMQIGLNGRTYGGSVYGWQANGSYWQLGEPIKAGAEGLVMFYLPQGTLTHCQTVSVTIDLARNWQYWDGRNVYANDQKALKAIDETRVTVCPGPIHGGPGVLN